MCPERHSKFQVLVLGLRHDTHTESTRAQALTANSWDQHWGCRKASRCPIQLEFQINKKSFFSARTTPILLLLRGVIRFIYVNGGTGD